MRPDCVTYSSTRESSVLRGMFGQLAALRDYRHVIYNLIRSRITQRYRGSVLGIFWSLLNPLFHLFALAFVFPLFMRARVEGYVVYLISGLVAWGFISHSINGGSDVILRSYRLLRQVYLPTILLPLVVVVTEAVNLLITVMALHVVIAVLGYPVQTNVVYLVAAMGVAFLFLFGVVGLLSVMIVYFRDVQHMLQNIMQGMFFLSAIFFPVDVIPERYRWLMEWNPFYQIIRLFHYAIYQPAEADWGWFVSPLAMAAACFVMALWVHHRFGRTLIYRL